MMFETKASIHFWPFDGFDVPEGKSVIAEVYPSLFRRLYAKQGRKPDEHDAYCVAAWLARMDSRGTLDHYFKPPRSLPELRQCRPRRLDSRRLLKIPHTILRYNCGTAPNLRPSRRTNLTRCFSSIFHNCSADRLIQKNQ